MSENADRGWKILAFFLALAIMFVIAGNDDPVSAAPLAAPTPNPGAMTVYSVSNANSVDINVQNVFTDTSGFNFSFWGSVPANSTVVYHVSQMPQVPSPFNGSLNLFSNQPFTAEVVSYDYPGSPTATATTTSTATSTPTLTNGTTATPTPSATPTLTPTSLISPTSTLTQTATPSGSPPPSATPSPMPSLGDVLLSADFEEASFSAGGWTLDVNGTGATAQLVATPVWSGYQAASFSTLTQQNGEHAFAMTNLSWPASNVETASAEVMPQTSAVQLYARIFSLETRGPGSWVTRAGFALGPTEFAVVYTTRDGILHYQNTSLTYQAGQWYNLTTTVDDRGANPSLTFLINGQNVYSLVDTTTGSQTDRPAVVEVGFGPGDWGSNTGTVTIDHVIAADGTTIPTATPTTPATATPSATSIVFSTPSGSPTDSPTATATVSPEPSPPSIIVTIIASSMVRVIVPPQTGSADSIVRVVASVPSTPVQIDPVNGEYQQFLTILVQATDAGGNEVHQLTVPATISITYRPAPGTNPSLAQISTLDLNGNVQVLSTQVVSNGDGTYTATAQTPHFSTFALSAPTSGALVRQIFIPIVNGAP